MRHMPPRADIIRTDAATWNLWGVGVGGAEFIHFFGHQGIRKSAVMIRGEKMGPPFSGLVLSAQPHLAAAPGDRGHYPTLPSTHTGSATLLPSGLCHPRSFGRLSYDWQESSLRAC